MTCGYLIVKTFGRMYLEYLELRAKMNYPLPDDRVIYSIPWKGAPVDTYAKQYRGVCREPLFPWNQRDEEVFRGSGMVTEPLDTELKAHLALGRLEQECEPDDEVIIHAHEDAIRLFDLLEAPVGREVIWIRDAESAIESQADYPLLGYEPAWLGGDWFSAISDCLCFPIWHGTDKEGELFKKFHEKLNEHALFDTPQLARDYLAYYDSFDWTEKGRYVITEVRLVKASR